ncbi:MAG: PilZ domain-containing protein [Hyphomicrobiaceae bacterium]|nr:PilZ domain-containing protein [Hyphomicrobiaceae bacterium]
MNISTTVPDAVLPAPIAPDQRRHKRVKMVIPGRFMRADKEEFPCRVLAISVGGADVATDQVVEPGERIVIYLDELGGIEGVAARPFSGGFAMDFKVTIRRQQKLAAQLTWLLNQAEIGAAEQRRPGHDRIKLDRKPITVVFANGDSVQCAALDVSISGAKIESPVRPPVSSEIYVSKLRARVVRHHPEGFSVQFMDIQEVRAIRRHFG